MNEEYPSETPISELIGQLHIDRPQKRVICEADSVLGNGLAFGVPGIGMREVVGHVSVGVVRRCGSADQSHAVRGRRIAGRKIHAATLGDVAEGIEGVGSDPGSPTACAGETRGVLHGLSERDPESVDVTNDKLTHAVEGIAKVFHDLNSVLDASVQVVDVAGRYVQVDLFLWQGGCDLS